MKKFKQYIKEKKLLTVTLKDIPVNTVVNDDAEWHFTKNLVPYIGKKIQVSQHPLYKNWYGFFHEYIHKSWLNFNPNNELELDI
jgi:hypothetical protein